MPFEISDLNFLAIAAGIVLFMVGGMAWYGVWAKPWMAETGITKEQIGTYKGTTKSWMPYVVAVVCATVITLSLASLVEALDASKLMGGIKIGAVTGIGLVATSIATNYAFEYKTPPHWVITAGYSVVMIIIVTVLLTLWQ
ncbi:MAG: DUF1761 domain-containing protein [SAR202 cluster bacterium]|nr:DUF1761 domain-containing protein [SAR202 cluster bacterium]